MMDSRPNLLRVWLFSLLIGFCLAVGGVLLGKTADCRIGERDGQCGMATALGQAFGALAGSTIVIVVTVHVLTLAFRRRRRN
jgi:hypothetical protein